MTYERKLNKSEVRDLFTAIPGIECALPVADIAYHLQIKLNHQTGSNLRKVIRELIEEGEPIGSCPAGYFRINTRGELEDYLESLQQRCDGIQTRINNVTDAYMSEINSRHLNTGIPLKDRCRFYVVYIAETCKIPYQAVWTMAYRKLQKLTGLNCVTMPSWYRGSVLNFVSTQGKLNDLYDVLTDLEEALI